MDRLLRALERMTGRRLDDGPRQKLKEWGILEPEWQERDQKTPSRKTAPSFRIPGAIPEAPLDIPTPNEQMRKQQIIAALLREAQDV